jgi:hypothetical protein
MIIFLAVGIECRVLCMLGVFVKFKWYRVKCDNYTAWYIDAWHKHFILLLLFLGCTCLGPLQLDFVSGQLEPQQDWLYLRDLQQMSWDGVYLEDCWDIGLTKKLFGDWDSVRRQHDILQRVQTKYLEMCSDLVLPLTGLGFECFTDSLLNFILWSLKWREYSDVIGYGDNIKTNCENEAAWECSEDEKA